MDSYLQMMFQPSLVYLFDTLETIQLRLDHVLDKFEALEPYVSKTVILGKQSLR